jgi:SseB protein N-terminal domain
MNFNPENQLETALVQAATDAAAVPLFYQLLLESPLFALTPPNSRPHGEGALQKGESVSIVNWADGERRVVPIFSSLPLLQEAVQGSPIACDYISLRGRELLGILAKGDAPALLNPTCPYSKELPVDEMRELVTGKSFEDQSAAARPAS